MNLYLGFAIIAVLVAAYGLVAMLLARFSVSAAFSFTVIRYPPSESIGYVSIIPHIEWREPLLCYTSWRRTVSQKLLNLPQNNASHQGSGYHGSVIRIHFHSFNSSGDMMPQQALAPFSIYCVCGRR